MTKVMKNLTKIVMICALLFALCFPLVACGNTDIKITTVSTTGGTVTGGGELKKDEEVTLTATPKQYYDFVGWYKVNDVTDVDNIDFNSLVVFNAEPTCTFKVKEAGNYVALFKPSPYQSIDRILAAANRKYNAFPQNNGDYRRMELEASVTLDVDLNGDAYNMQKLRIDVKGNIDLDGKGTEIFADFVNDATSASVFKLFFKDGETNSQLYINSKDSKKAVALPTVRDIENIFKAPAVVNAVNMAANSTEPTENVWSLEGLLGTSVSPAVLQALQGVLGGANSLGLFGDVVNTETYTEMQVHLSSVFSLVPMLSGLGVNLGVFGDVLDALTAGYSDPANMPFLRLTLRANYIQEEGKEVLDNASLSLFSTDEFNFSETSSIPAITSIKISANKINMNYMPANTEFTAIAFDTAGYTQTSSNINFESRGTLNMVKKATTAEAQDTVTAYDVAIMSDINPFAILAGITNTAGKLGFDVTKIDWTRVGMFNLNITNRETNEDYLRIYFDSTAYETPKLLVRTHFPKPLLVIKFDVNAMYDVNTLMDFIQNQNDVIPQPTAPVTPVSNQALTAAASTTPNALDLSFVAPILRMLPVLMTSINGNMDAGAIITQLIKEFSSLLNSKDVMQAGIQDALKTDLTYENHIATLQLAKLREALVVNVRGADLPLLPILVSDSDYITVQMTEGDFGLITKTEGQYVDGKGNKLADAVNKEKVIVKVNSLDIDGKKLYTGYNLKDVFSTVNATVLYSDGTTGEYTMKAEKIIYDNEITTPGNKTATLYLKKFGRLPIETTVSSYLPFPLPIGLYPYKLNFEVVDQLVDSEIEWNIANTVEGVTANKVGATFSDFGYAKYHSLETDIETVDANGSVVDGKFVKGIFNVKVKAFGCEKTITVYNYEILNTLPTEIDYKADDLFTQLYDKVKLNYGAADINSSSIIVSVGGDYGFITLTAQTPSIKTAAKNESGQFDSALGERALAYLDAQADLTNLRFDFTVNLQGRDITYTQRIDVIRTPQVETSTVSYYSSQDVFVENIYMPARYQLDLVSDGSYVLKYTIIVDGVGQETLTAETGTYTLDGNNLTLTKEGASTAIHATLINGTISFTHANLGQITVTNFKGTVISSNSESIMPGTVNLTIKSDNSWIVWMGDAEVTDMSTQTIMAQGSRFELNILNNTFTFVVDATKSYSGTFADGVLTLDLSSNEMAGAITNPEGVQFQITPSQPAA